MPRLAGGAVLLYDKLVLGFETDIAFGLCRSCDTLSGGTSYRAYEIRGSHWLPVPGFLEKMIVFNATRYSTDMLMALCYLVVRDFGSGLARFFSVSYIVLNYFMYICLLIMLL